MPLSLSPLQSCDLISGVFMRDGGLCRFQLTRALLRISPNRRIDRCATVTQSSIPPGFPEITIPSARNSALLYVSHPRACVSIVIPLTRLYSARSCRAFFAPEFLPIAIFDKKFGDPRHVLRRSSCALIDLQRILIFAKCLISPTYKVVERNCSLGLSLFAMASRQKLRVYN